MGSAGSGKFGTYRFGGGQITGGSGTGNGDSGVIGGLGGEAGEIECPKNIEYIRLEDVATSDYYANRKSLPHKGDSVKLSNTINYGRLVVTASTGEVLGNLPTQYNYLINCIKKDMQYSGTILASGLTPIPFVVVTLHV